MTNVFIVLCRLACAAVPQADATPGGHEPRAAIVPIVTAVAETVPVPTIDDAADDAAIWANPLDPAAGLVVGTDKRSGLGVYRLDGSLVGFHDLGPLNNVDLRDGITLAAGRAPMIIVAASDREHDTFRLFEMSPTGSLTEVGAELFETGLQEAYGLCMHHGAASGQTHVFINDKRGRVEQWRLVAAGTAAAPRVGATLVRSFWVGGQPEGMAADDELGWLYVGEERTGLWRYHAEPWTLADDHPFSLEESDHERAPVDVVGPHGRLAADVEGVDIARIDSMDGRGVLVVSSQSADRFDVYERVAPNAYIGSFRVGGVGGVDAVTHTDGVAVIAGDFGPSYPGGLVVVQDDENPGSTQNFKLVALGGVLSALGLGTDATASSTRPVGSLGPSHKDVNR